MISFEAEQLRRHPDWRKALQVYWTEQVRQRAAQPDADGWVPRLSQIEDIASDQLAGIHGRLIAFGFLKFDLSGRDVGMRYQLTPLARQLLGQPSAETDADAAAASDTGVETTELAESA
jgi:hypothetical protein